MQRKVLLNGRIVVNGGYEVDFYYISKRKEGKILKKIFKVSWKKWFKLLWRVPFEENWKKNAKNWQAQKTLPHTVVIHDCSLFKWKMCPSMTRVSTHSQKRERKKNLFFSLFAPNNINISFHCWRTKMSIIKSKIAIRRLPSPKQ